MNHITFVDPIDPINLKVLDTFKWRDKVISQTFEHTKVLWKGNHILTIKKHVDFDHKTESVNDSEDDEDDNPQPPGSVTKWLLHTNWDWLQHFYGEFNTLTEAKEAATKTVATIANNISRAMAIRKPRASSS